MSRVASMGDDVDTGRVQSKYETRSLGGTAPAPGPEYQVCPGAEQQEGRASSYTDTTASEYRLHQ